MYSRDFGGIKSEGQLYNLEREYNERYSEPEPQKYEYEREHHNELERHEKPRGLKLDFLRDLKIDDLILIGIGILLLLDSDGENDIFTIIIVLMLMF